MEFIHGLCHDLSQNWLLVTHPFNHQEDISRVHVHIIAGFFRYMYGGKLSYQYDNLAKTLPILI